MKDKESFNKSSGSLKRAQNLVGFYSAITLTVITVVTFSFALTAIPISGAFAPEGGLEYPYLDTVSQYPKDYLWMFPAIFLILSYIILMIAIHSYASNEKKIFSQISLAFTIVSAVLLLGNYFIQFSVIPASLINGETEGITLLTQYNPHGIFIALEDLGYLMMSLSFLFIAPVFTKKNRIESAIRWIFIIAFVLTIISLVIISIRYGIIRKDRLEVAVITIDWMVLIINGILLSILFRNQLKAA